LENRFLFLDRDGVINKKIENDYVRTWENFEFIAGSLEAIVGFRGLFDRIFIVTNQRGVGKGVMTELQLKDIHDRMLGKIEESAGSIDCIYSCFEIFEESSCRKPNTGMAILAQNDFPEVDFSRSVIIGDSKSDMEFGKRLGMITVFIGIMCNISDELIDINEGSLFDFYSGLKDDRYKKILK
jgi:D-glycero-D-manno-heptose 1,7-bisphosphate phosphatase